MIPLQVAETEALRLAHETEAAAHPDVHLDGPHVLASDLASDLASCPAVPTVLAAMPSEGAAEAACCWCVLGVTRLHHLLVTGEMTTKSRAGRWGPATYPERFHRVLRIREGIDGSIAGGIHEGRGDEYPHDRDARGHDTAALTARVVGQGTGT